MEQSIKDKLQEIIQNDKGHNYYDDEGNCLFYYESVESIAEEAYQLGVPKWVSITDALPEYGGEYNVVLDLQDGGSPVSGIMEFDGVKNIWNYPGTNVECTDVTHWMELPLPPSPIVTQDK